jgi:DNA-binding NarL/FixJ family response regulator
VLVGRQGERAQLADALVRAQLGSGSIVLLAGEAGVGKTRLADELADGAGAVVLRAACTQAGTTPYGPVAAVLRSYLRARPHGLDGCGSLVPHLALILPELGAPAEVSDRPALFEAIRAAFAQLASERAALVVLDDLQWSDAATLELLSALAEPLAEMSLLLLATYRSDGLPRDHGLRRLRNELRRAGRLDELMLAPLDGDETAAMLRDVLGAPLSPALVRAVHDRTQGVPFFVEELARALLVSRALRQGRQGLELAAHGEVPVPETVRDAVLVGAAELSAKGRAAADAAAVAGEWFDLDLIAELTDEAGVAELIGSELALEEGPGRGRFRHALTREALYADIAWMRRRRLHRALAEALAAGDAPSALVATQWLGARDSARARAALLRAAAESEALRAYRDAAEAGRQALELWPEADDADDPARLEAVERYARCSEFAGDLTEAGRAWREVSDVRAARGEQRQLGEAQRRLAAVHDLKGERDAAFAARGVAASAFRDAGLPAEAALDHMAMANHLRATGKYHAAVELVRTAREEADGAGRLDIRIRALGLEGVARSKGGDHEGGLETVRAALALALEHDMTSAAADIYQRLSLVLYDAADYTRAEEALATALDLCRASGDEGIEEACVSCLAYVLRDLGDWSAAAQRCRDLIAAGNSVFVAEGLLGSIHGAQGRLSSARRLLASCQAVASKLGHYNMTVDSTAGLAAVAAYEGRSDEAAAHCRALLGRWEQSDDHHYAISGLRWGAAFLARQGDRAGAHDCAGALTQIAADTGHAEAVGALAHALGELALLDGQPGTAAEQLTRAVELWRTIDMPYQRAQVELRAGVALAAAGERELALERLSGAYRAARKLGARPLAAEAAREVAELGESVVRRLGTRASADSDGHSLSRRELEVVRLLAVGRTNAEIAQELFLSRRTVDMHVRNILRKLDCRSRIEAAHRAGEIGLLV